MAEEVNNTAEQQPLNPSNVLSQASRKFVVRRADGKLEPVMGEVQGEIEARLRREVVEGGKEVDLYVYVGTFRPVRTAEMIDVFGDEPGERVR